MQIKDKKVIWTFYDQPETTEYGLKIASTKDYVLYQDKSEFRIYCLKKDFEIVGHGCETLGDCIVYIEMFSGHKGYYNKTVNELVDITLENRKLCRTINALQLKVKEKK